MQTGWVGGAGRRTLAGLLCALIAAACSGDPSSEQECGGRGQPPCRPPASGGAGPGTAGAAADNGGGGSGGSGFGNSDAMIPDLPIIDGGRPGPGQTTNPDEPMCGGLEIEPEIEMRVIPGNILLVFDKSGSMCETWNNSTRRKWEDAYEAVSAAIDPLKASITIGSIFFPDTPTGAGNSCYVPPIENAPQIPFTDGPAFLAAWSGYWSAAITHPSLCQQRTANPVNGATPLLAALQAADAALTAAALPNTTRVVIITDGQPNCSGGRSSTDEPLANLTPVIEAWLSQGIRTHVVGLPGVESAIPLLDGLAVAGGTGQHILATDPSALQSEIAQIIGESVTTNFDSCRIGLPHAPPDPEDVNLVVVERGTEQAVGRDLGAGGGWALSADNSEIVLQGLFCELAKQGQYDRISVIFGCVELPPLPPPQPPE